MPEDSIPVNAETAAAVRFAARVAGLSESEVVEHAVRSLSEPATPVADPWEAIPVYCEYEGHRVNGEYLRATRRLTITSGTLEGQTFKSPSAAARAAVAALNPQRKATQTNGWRFWKVAATHRRLETMRP